jgi:predicted metal-dependent phosphoesterase TrpH
MLIDLHVHSHHTRGCSLLPRDVVRRAKEVGLDGVVFTDINALDGLEEIRAAGRDESFLALCGVELTTDRGHYLCYFPDPSRVPAPPQVFGSTPWPVQEVLRKVGEMGGVVVAAHPYDKTIERPGGDVIFTLSGLTAIEGLNARCKSGINDLAMEAADHMSLPCVGSSGTHESLDGLGKAATLFREPVATEADLVAQLRTGTVFCAAIGVSPAPADPDRRGGPDRRDHRGGHGDRRGGDHRPSGGGGRGGPGRGGRDRDRR